MVSGAVIVVAASLGVAAAVVLVLARNGLLSTLRTTEVTFGPYLLLYVNSQGPYHTAPKHCKALQRLVIEEAHMDAPALHGSRTRLGFFYDDPRSTPAPKCRFSMCCHIPVPGTSGSTDYESYVKSLESQLSVCKSGELKVGHFPESRCLAVKLPFYGRLSVLNAVLRAYPFLLSQATAILGKQQAEAAMALGLMEIYRPQEHTMYVVLPLTQRSTMLPF